MSRSLSLRDTCAFLYKNNESKNPMAWWIFSYQTHSNDRFPYKWNAEYKIVMQLEYTYNVMSKQHWSLTQVCYANDKTTTHCRWLKVCTHLHNRLWSSTNSETCKSFTALNTDPEGDMQIKEQKEKPCIYVRGAQTRNWQCSICCWMLVLVTFKGTYCLHL